MFGLGPTELIIILVVVLLLFGGKKLPELARALGKRMSRRLVLRKRLTLSRIIRATASRNQPEVFLSSSFFFRAASKSSIFDVHGLFGYAAIKSS